MSFFKCNHFGQYFLGFGFLLYIPSFVVGTEVTVVVLCNRVFFKDCFSFSMLAFYTYLSFCFSYIVCPKAIYLSLSFMESFYISMRQKGSLHRAHFLISNIMGGQLPSLLTKANGMVNTHFRVRRDCYGLGQIEKVPDSSVRKALGRKEPRQRKRWVTEVTQQRNQLQRRG